MSEELLPCPFCGGPAELDAYSPFCHYRTGVPLTQVAAYCSSCSATIAWYPDDLALSHEETIEHVIEEWNRRAPATCNDSLQVGTVEAVREACAKVAEDHMPMIQCMSVEPVVSAVERIAAAIRAMPLPQAEAAKVEPVAWLYTHGDGDRVAVPLAERDPGLTKHGWTETPLIPAPKGQSDE